MLVLVLLGEFRLVGVAGAVTSGVGGAALLTVTVMEAAVVVLPAASLATAERVWVPLLRVVVFQTVEYGELVSSAPWSPPSILNCTPVTPTLSEALAEIVTELPETVAPFEGAVREMVGATVSQEVVVIWPVASARLCTLPAASYGSMASV